MAADLMAGLRVIKSLGVEAPAVGRYRDASRAVLAGALRSARSKAPTTG